MTRTLAAFLIVGTAWAQTPAEPGVVVGVGGFSHMGNTPGAQSRPAILHIPGSKLGVELIDYKDIDRQAVHPRFQDPGAASLILTVRDVDATVKALKAAGATVISRNGEPVMNGTSKFCIVRDPNNLFLELFQRGPRPQEEAPQ